MNLRYGRAVCSSYKPARIYDRGPTNMLKVEERILSFKTNGSLKKNANISLSLQNQFKVLFAKFQRVTQSFSQFR